jgi:hypothetical protein
MFTLQSGTIHGTPYTFDLVDTDTIPDYLWPGGYAVEYVTPDGDILCGACVRNAFLDDHLSDHDMAINGEIAGPCEAHESEHSTGLMCDGCNEWIIEPHCVECTNAFTRSDQTSPYPWFDAAFGDDSGSILICATCLAKQVIDDQAVKTGKRTYQLTGDQWYRVNSPVTFTR